jgi:hypothetical protein
VPLTRATAAGHFMQRGEPLTEDEKVTLVGVMEPHHDEPSCSWARVYWVSRTGRRSALPSDRAGGEVSRWLAPKRIDEGLRLLSEATNPAQVDGLFATLSSSALLHAATLAQEGILGHTPCP